MWWIPLILRNTNPIQMTPSSVPFDIIIIIIIGTVWAEGMFLGRVSAPTFPKYWWGGAAAGEWALLGQGELHKERDTGLWCIVEWIDKGIHLFIDFCILDIYIRCRLNTHYRHCCYQSLSTCHRLLSPCPCPCLFNSGQVKSSKRETRSKISTLW